jgi:pSer/pThr/pTyr-binding forkhead associated (FHA) protein
MDVTSRLPSDSQSPRFAGELVVRNGRMSGARCPLQTPLTLLGQSAAADIRLRVDGIEALHCAISVDDRGLLLRDLGSAAGTSVNGQRVVTHRLSNGDLVEIGPFQFGVVLAAPTTSEAPSANAVLLDREREAVHVQVAAVAAQQALLTEEESRLEQRSTALQRQEAQLASHLHDRQQRLDEQYEQLRRDRAAFEKETENICEILQSERDELDRQRREVIEQQQQNETQRQRLRELRRRLARRYRRLSQQQQKQLQARLRELDAAQQQLEQQRAAVQAVLERHHTELELGRREYREQLEELALAQQQWETTLNEEYQQRRRQQKEMEQQAAQLAIAKQQAQQELQQAERQRSLLVREIAGLQARVSNLRTQLEQLTNIVTVSPAGPTEEIIPPPMATALQPTTSLPPDADLLREVACHLHDQRLHLLEQWQRLLHIHETWHNERSAALAELQNSADELSRREARLNALEMRLRQTERQLQQRQEAFAERQCALEAWQTRLRTEELAWQARREELLGELEQREFALRQQREHLNEVQQGRQQEILALRVAYQQCEEARRQYGLLCQECEKLAEELASEQRKLVAEAQALNAVRQELLTQAADTSRTDQQIERLARLERTRLERAEKQQRQAQRVQQQQQQLETQRQQLTQWQATLLAAQEVFTQRIAAWEAREQAIANDELQRQTELQRLRTQAALAERQSRQLREELERLACALIEEAPASDKGYQAA